MTGSIKAEPTLTEKVDIYRQQTAHDAGRMNVLVSRLTICVDLLLRVVQDGIKSDDVDRLIRKKHSEMTAAGEWQRGRYFHAADV
jgi:hypothetical protein